MENCARLYNCARCRKQVLICRDCDRGNIYCAPACAQSARSASQRRAGQRYQSSRRGRHHHADRQRRYRQRLKEKVTHQGSPADSAGALLPVELRRRWNPAVSLSLPPNDIIQCHGCGQVCSPFVRLAALRGRYPPRSSRNVPGSSRS